MYVLFVCKCRVSLVNNVINVSGAQYGCYYWPACRFDSPGFFACFLRSIVWFILQSIQIRHTYDQLSQKFVFTLTYTFVYICTYVYTIRNNFVYLKKKVYIYAYSIFETMMRLCSYKRTHAYPWRKLIKIILYSKNHHILNETTFCRII